jgi:hypothetical protein
MHRKKVEVQLCGVDDSIVQNESLLHALELCSVGRKGEVVKSPDTDGQHCGTRCILFNESEHY